MKKLLLGVTFAFVCSVSTRGQSVSACQQTALTLNLDNVITLCELYNTMGAHFASATNYNDEMTLTHDNIGQDGEGSGSNTFTVQSNRYFNVSISCATTNFSYAGGSNYSADNTSMCVNIIRYYVGNNNTGGSVAFGLGAPLPIAANVPKAVLNNCHNGNSQTFDMQFLADPSWAYAGGVYTASISITATQE